MATDMPSESQLMQLVNSAASRVIDADSELKITALNPRGGLYASSSCFFLVQSVSGVKFVVRISYAYTPIEYFTTQIQHISISVPLAKRRQWSLDSGGWREIEYSRLGKPSDMSGSHAELPHEYIPNLEQCNASEVHAGLPPRTSAERLLRRLRFLLPRRHQEVLLGDLSEDLRRMREEGYSERDLCFYVALQAFYTLVERLKPWNWIKVGAIAWLVSKVSGFSWLARLMM